MNHFAPYHRPNSAGWSYWEHELEWDKNFHVQFPSDTLQKKYDFVVIGAGFTGLSTAYHLSLGHPSAQIAIIDKHQPPLGASTRNAGFACIGTVGEFLADAELEEKDVIWDRMKSRWDGLELLRSILGDQAIGYEASGGHELFTSKDSYAKVESHIKLCDEALRARIGRSDWYQPTKVNNFDAIHMPNEGCLQPAKAWQSFAQKCRERSIKLCWGVNVSNIHHHIDGVTIELALDQLHDVISAKAVVLATNAFSSTIKSTDCETSSVQPGRGMVWVTKPLSSLKWRGTFHAEEGYIYFRSVGENRLLLGGARHIDKASEETLSFGVNTKIAAFLKQYMQEILQVSPETIAYEWSGIMGFTSNKNPICKASDSGNEIHAVGLSGMGVALSTELGRSAALLLN